MARREVAWIVLASLLAGAAARAEDVQAVDEDFLEFLGSLDSDDEAWSEFLTMADDAKADPQGEDVRAKPAEKVKSDEGK